MKYKNEKVTTKSLKSTNQTHYKKKTSKYHFQEPDPQPKDYEDIEY